LIQALRWLLFLPSIPIAWACSVLLLWLVHLLILLVVFAPMEFIGFVEPVDSCFWTFITWPAMSGAGVGFITVFLPTFIAPSHKRLAAFVSATLFTILYLLLFFLTFLGDSQMYEKLDLMDWISQVVHTLAAIAAAFYFCIEEYYDQY
jgi:hypothetical protein